MGVTCCAKTARKIIIESGKKSDSLILMIPNYILGNIVITCCAKTAIKIIKEV